MGHLYVYQIGFSSAQLLRENTYLTTGFVGTTYLCLTLSSYGLNDMAYSLLLNEDMPSWLYEVNMGATTIWERWDSILPNGKVNPKGMNSMNHYTYGSIMEWMYRYMCGINPSEQEPGFRKALINPIPDKRITNVECRYDSPMGIYKVEWNIEGEKVHYSIKIPFGAIAIVKLPGVKKQTLRSGEYGFVGKIPDVPVRKKVINEKKN